MRWSSLLTTLWSCSRVGSLVLTTRTTNVLSPFARSAHAGAWRAECCCGRSAFVPDGRLSTMRRSSISPLARLVRTSEPPSPSLRNFERIRVSGALPDIDTYRGVHHVGCAQFGSGARRVSSHGIHAHRGRWLHRADGDHE